MNVIRVHMIGTTKRIWFIQITYSATNPKKSYYELYLLKLYRQQRPPKRRVHKKDQEKHGESWLKLYSERKKKEGHFLGSQKLKNPSLWNTKNHSCPQYFFFPNQIQFVFICFPFQSIGITTLVGTWKAIGYIRINEKTQNENEIKPLFFVWICYNKWNNIYFLSHSSQVEEKNKIKVNNGIRSTSFQQFLSSFYQFNK